MIDRYDWAGGSEALWRFGPQDGPVVAWALPPFEEANRTRTLVVRMCRLLAHHGIGAVLPDLPGQGESTWPTEAATLEAWRQAFVAACTAAGSPVVSATIRAGALVDHDAVVAGRWQLAPQPGAALIRELHRIGGDGIELGGNRIGERLRDALANAEPAVVEPLRVVRLGSDPAPADHRIAAAPPWRRAEPSDDPALAAALVADLAAWTHACAGC
ncbi:hypothetical protein [Sphingomonas sp. VNH70]|uniref:hypothetical protein n=1 Tax=Sphingomonas silueang TaxID=3156617 RepID=UPI0032B5484C